MKNVGIIVIAVLVLFCIGMGFLNFSIINGRFNVVQSEIALRDNRLFSHLEDFKKELTSNLRVDTVFTLVPMVATPKKKKREKKILDTLVVVDQYKNWKDSISLLHDSISGLQTLMNTRQSENEENTVLLVAQEQKQGIVSLHNYIDSLHTSRIDALRKEDYLFKAVNKSNINLILLQSKVIDKYHYVLYSVENESKQPFTPTVNFALSAIKSSGVVESIAPDKKSISWAIFEGKNSSITIENLPLTLQIK